MKNEKDIPNKRKSKYKTQKKAGITFSRTASTLARLAYRVVWERMAHGRGWQVMRV